MCYRGITLVWQPRYHQVRIYLSIYLSLSLSLYIYIYICNIYISIHLSVYLSIYQGTNNNYQGINNNNYMCSCIIIEVCGCRQRSENVRETGWIAVSATKVPPGARAALPRGAPAGRRRARSANANNNNNDNNNNNNNENDITHVMLILLMTIIHYSY